MATQTPALITDLQTACAAAINQKDARCRHMVSGYGYCFKHARDPKPAPAPDQVLFKIRVNEKRVAWLKELKIPLKVRDEAAIEARHVAAAEEIGRQAHAIRSVADSGTPVFGEKGCQLLTKVSDLWDELPRHGFRPVDCHMYQKDQRQKGIMTTVVVEFVRNDERPDMDPGLISACREECDVTLGYLHVWANPRNAQGKVIHTVNSSHRKPSEKPRGQLVYHNGLWALAEVQS